MRISDYDKALEKKLTSIFPNVEGASPDEAFNTSDDHNDQAKIRIPLITFYRLSNPISDTVSHPEAFSGRITLADMQKASGTAIRTLPMTITYQIDIWATSRETIDDIYRELVFYFHRNPNLVVEDKSEFEEPLEFSMRLVDTETTASTQDFNTNNRLYNYTLTYEVDAKLFYKKLDVNLIKFINIDIN